MTRKTCTLCGETKPLAEFYLRHAHQPNGPRRSRCKSCLNAERLRRMKEGPALVSEIIAHYADKDAPLSERAEKAIYSDEPLFPPHTVAALERRKRLAAQREKARQRALKKQDVHQPYQWGPWCPADEVAA